MYPSQIVSCWITYIDIQFKNESVENIRCVEMNVPFTIIVNKR